jgi:starvation-inducible outer membrane lipoprotein
MLDRLIEKPMKKLLLIGLVLLLSACARPPQALRTGRYCSEISALLQFAMVKETFLLIANPSVAYVSKNINVIAINFFMIINPLGFICVYLIYEL